MNSARLTKLADVRSAFATANHSLQLSETLQLRQSVKLSIIHFYVHKLLTKFDPIHSPHSFTLGFLLFFPLWPSTKQPTITQ